MSNKAVRGTAEAWESGQLGASKSHARRVESDLEQQIDEALGLQAISIRLPRSTIKAYKNLAEIHGVGYQPLMREAICRWVEGEMKQMLAGAAEGRRQQQFVETDGAVEVEVDHAPPARRKRAA